MQEASFDSRFVTEEQCWNLYTMSVSIMHRCVGALLDLVLIWGHLAEV